MRLGSTLYTAAASPQVYTAASPPNAASQPVCIAPVQLPQSGCPTAGQLHLAIGNPSEDSSPISPSRGQPASAPALASSPLRGQPAPAPAQQLGNALAVTSNVSSAAKESLTTLLGSLDSIDMITDSQRLHVVVQKLIDAFYKQHSEMAEQHTQLLASKEAQQKLQEALYAIMHGCNTTITSLQHNAKSAQTILQPVSAGTDDSPAASGKYDNWEHIAYRVSGPHLGWFDDSPSDDIEIWLMVLTAPCTDRLCSLLPL